MKNFQVYVLYNPFWYGNGRPAVKLAENHSLGEQINREAKKKINKNRITQLIFTRTLLKIIIPRNHEINR